MPQRELHIVIDHDCQWITITEVNPIAESLEEWAARDPLFFQFGFTPSSLTVRQLFTPSRRDYAINPDENGPGRRTSR